MSSMPSVSATATARDVEFVCCTDCCAKFVRSPTRGVPSPSIHKVNSVRDGEAAGTGAAKADKVAEIIKESK